MGKAEKGSVLVMVMVTMAALLILGVVLANTGSAEILGTSRQEQKMKAFYLARSGAEAVASSIIKDPALAGSISGKESDPKDLGGGTFKVKVVPSGDDLLLTATGKFRRAEETISLTLKKSNVSLETLFDKVIFTNGDLDISANNAHVYGDVESKGKITGEPEMNQATGEPYETIQYSEKVYPSPSFPDISYTRNKPLNNVIDRDCHYQEIVANNEEITVRTDGKDIQVIADKVDIKGKLTIKGGGRLLLFVAGDAEFKTPSVSSAGSLYIFMQDGSTITLQGNAGKDENFYGYIYAPTATVIMNSAQTEIHGGIIADRLVKNEGSDDFQGTLYYHEETEVDPDDFVSIISLPSYQRSVWE